MYRDDREEGGGEGREGGREGEREGGEGGRERGRERGRGYLCSGLPQRVHETPHWWSGRLVVTPVGVIGG